MYSLKKLERLHLSANDDERIQSIESIETYTYETNKYIIYKNEEIKNINIINWFHRNISLWSNQKPSIQKWSN